MAKPLNPNEIEEARKTSTRSERREQIRREIQDGIEQNRGSNGVVVIPPQRKQVSPEDTPKLRVAAYCRVSTQEEQQVGSFEMQVHHFRQKIESNPLWELVDIYRDVDAPYGQNAKRP